MLVNTGTLTTVLDQFLEIFRLGQQEVGLQAWSLLTTLAGIELVLAALWWAMTGQDALVGLIRRILSIGFFVFVIQNYDILLHTVIEGFISTGKTAASPGGQSFNFVRDPSTIVDAGYVATLPIFDHLRSYSGYDVLANLHDIIITGLCAIGIVTAYFIIAIQVFVTYLEFAIVSTLGLILVPFGVFKHTAFLAEKVFGAIISFGVKLMVLGLLVSVTVPVLAAFTVPPSPEWPPLFNLLVVSMAVAALAWHAPGVAAGLLAGGPSLSASTAAGATHAAASGLAASAVVTRSAGRGVGGSISEVGRAAGSTAVTAAGAAGSAWAGAVGAATKLEAAGAGRPAQVAGAVMGAGGAVASQAARALLRPVTQLGTRAFANFMDKRTSGASFGARGGDAATNTTGATEGAASAGSAQSTFGYQSGPPKSDLAKQVERVVSHGQQPRSEIQTAFHLAQRGITPTAQPSANLSFPLKHHGDKPND